MRQSYLVTSDWMNGLVSSVEDVDPRVKRRAEFLANLKKGDKIVTIGGLYGIIVRLNEKTATIQIAEKVEVDIARSAVSHQQPARGNDATAEK